MTKRVVLTNVRRGVGKRSRYTYANLIDAETRELVISATLEYIQTAIDDRGYVVVNEKEAA